jgi:hypothetical protein
MILRFGIIAAITFVSGCAASPSPKNTPAQVQVNFNVIAQDQHRSPKSVARGAMSGVPQRVGFYYSVNPDCSSDGLVQTQVKSPPTHGSVTFVKADGYTTFPSTSASHDCNTKKSPGVAVMYTSAKDFVGTDQFTIQGIGPHGVYLESDYAVKVIAP